jgi:hypothetical protein
MVENMLISHAHFGQKIKNFFNKLFFRVRQSDAQRALHISIPLTRNMQIPMSNKITRKKFWANSLTHGCTEGIV